MTLRVFIRKQTKFHANNTYDLFYGFEVALLCTNNCIQVCMNTSVHQQEFPAKIQTSFVRTTIFKMCWKEEFFENGVSKFLATTTDKSGGTSLLTLFVKIDPISCKFSLLSLLSSEFLGLRWGWGERSNCGWALLIPAVLLCHNCGWAKIVWKTVCSHRNQKGLQWIYV